MFSKEQHRNEDIPPALKKSKPAQDITHGVTNAFAAVPVQSERGASTAEVLSGASTSFAAVVKEIIQVSNAGWGARMAEHTNSLAIEMERRAIENIKSCRCAMESLRGAIDAKVDSIDVKIGNVVPAVVQSLIRSSEFKDQVSTASALMQDVVVQRVVQGLINNTGFIDAIVSRVVTAQHSASPRASIPLGFPTAGGGGN